MKEYPENAELYRARARVKIMKGEIKQAIKMLRQIKDEGQELECNLEIGKQLYDEGKKKMHLDTFLKQEKSNDDPRVIANLIRTTEEVGLKDIQDKILNGLTIEKREVPEIKAAIGFIMLKRGEYESAEKIFRSLCKANNSVGNWLNLIACMRGLKKSNDALQTTKQAHILHPESKKIKHCLVQCFAEVGEHESAAKQIRTVIDEIEIADDEEMFNVQFLGEG